MTTFSYPCPDPVALAAKVHKAGGPLIDPNQTSGELPPHEGVTLSYVFDPGAHTLTFTVVKKPFFVPIGSIKSVLDEYCA
jgi:hypothetical protein